jgi:pimeloyl-ACP methyl ester carboxylesterase
VIQMMDQPPETDRGATRWLKTGLVVAFAALAMTALGGRLYELLAESRDDARYPAPGRLITIGDVKLHLRCTGERRNLPTVVLETGMGGWSELWPLQQPELSKTLRVCSYDRAGYGWSELGHGPHDVKTLADELHLLLKSGNESGEYVLVGASFGGLIVRMYQHRYPAEVVGMVLVDPAHEDAVTRLPPAYLLKERDRRPVSWLDRLQPALAALGWWRITASSPESQTWLAPNRRAPFVSVAVRPHHIEAKNCERESWDLSDQEMRSIGRIGSTPVIVLTATVGSAADILEARRILHRELAELSDRSEQRLVPKMSHASYLFDKASAAAVNQAVFDMVNRISSGKGCAERSDADADNINPQGGRATKGRTNERRS